MATIFTNTTFYADPDPTTHYRIPVALTYEDPETPDPGDTGTGTENPDPGGPGGGTGTGGDIGNVDGSGTSTTGSAGSVTRKTHSQDIFTSAGATLTFTYVADFDCSWVLKGGYEDMTTSVTDDGRELTVTWNVPSGEPGDSTYVGAEAWRYGDDTSEEYTAIWDRLHIGKASSDVVRGGIGQSITIIQDAAESLLSTAGNTLIITDGDYSDDRDFFHVGYHNFTQSAATSIANGVHTIVNGTDHVGATYSDANVTKYTVIMAETPLGVKLLRNGRQGGISFYGNQSYRAGGNNGFRSVIGIKAKGFAVRNAVPDATGNAAISDQRAIRCSFDYCSGLEDLVIGEASGYSGDGSIIRSRNSVNTNREYCQAFGNQRMLCGVFFGTGSASLYTTFRGVLATNGCTQMVREDKAQTFTSYGSAAGSWLNCYGLDGAFFADGAISGANRIDQNHCFAQTNGGNNDIVVNGSLMLNDVRAGTFSNSSGSETGNNDRFINTTFWGRLDRNSAYPDGSYMLRGDKLSLEGVTVGKNDNIFLSPPLSTGWIGGNLDNLAIVSPTWDVYPGTSETMLLANGTLSAQNKLTIVANYHVDPNIRNAVTSYYKFDRVDARQVGCYYISRQEPNSTFSDENLGARDIFIAVGRYGKFRPDSGWDTEYDGTGGNEYVNRISRMPWLEFRAERQLYDCTSNGNQYLGTVGVGKTGINPIDYINRFGTTPSKPLNCPHPTDIYGKALGSGQVAIWWRPVSPAYRDTITGVELFIDGINVTPVQLPKSTTTYTHTGVNTGTRNFQVRYVDPVYGNSGLSRTYQITVT